jgi:hypothetical protein
VTATSARAGLAEPVAHGLIRDVVQMAVGSYVGLRAAGHQAEWPAPVSRTEADHAAALDALAAAATREHENDARDALARVARQPGPRPLTVARARDALLVRTSATGSIAVLLNVLRATASDARPATIRPGVQAATGEVLPGGVSKTRLAIPLACSKWHENKFLSGRAILWSSLVVRRGDRWFLCAQFEMPEQTVQPSGARVGVDRGIVNPVAMVAVAADGRVLPPPNRWGRRWAGRSATPTRAAAPSSAGAARRATGTPNASSIPCTGSPNRVVAEAKAQRAQVVVEKLDEFKRTIVAKRAPGARRGGWRRTLKRAQLGRLEAILAYKLALAGLPPPVEVVAGGTSQTCPACGHRAAENRAAQDRFACVACGFVGHADVVGAVNIARRGVAMEGIKRGDTLAPRERDMVSRLRARDDGGLGPLAAPAAGGFVAGRAAVPTADDPATGDTVGAGQNTTDGAQNAREGVFAARGAAFSGDRSKRNSGSRQGFGP